MILESKPLHKKKKRLARKTKDQGSDGSPQVRRNTEHSNYTWHKSNGCSKITTTTSKRKVTRNLGQKNQVTSTDHIWFRHHALFKLPVFLQKFHISLISQFLLVYSVLRGSHIFYKRCLCLSRCSSLLWNKAETLAWFGQVSGDTLLLSLCLERCEECWAHILELRIYVPPACCANCKKKKKLQLLLFPVFHSIHINQLLSSGCLYKTVRKAPKG